MIHERSMTATLQLSGPLHTIPPVLRAKLNEIADSIRIQEEGFADLVRGSQVTLDDLKRRAPDNWYIEASEARA